MNIWVYTLCYNELAILPYFLKHYAAFCSRIVIYDNGSTDGSLEHCKDFAATHPEIELVVRPVYSTKIDEREYLKIKNNCWKEARMSAVDYVIVVDTDEFLWFDEGLPKLLDHLRAIRPLALQSTGYQMVSHEFPFPWKDARREALLTDVVKEGTLDVLYNKLVLFDPMQVEDIHYSPGCHISFTLSSLLNPLPNLKLLHYKNLSVNYVFNKYNQLKERLSDFNLKNNYGNQYTKDFETIQGIHKELWDIRGIVVLE